MAEDPRKPRIKIMAGGPYLVTGSVPLSEQSVVSDGRGTPCEYRETKRYPAMRAYRLCRCGKSRATPFCDGSHGKAGFTGSETADRAPFAARAAVYAGPGLILEDVESLCALARFCHIGGNTWALIEKSDNAQARELAIRGACLCPAGRLVVRDAQTGEAIEDRYEPSIVLLTDESGMAGPIWVRGGIPIESADGTEYEARNRVTLCRCGKSQNMPFCDASHYWQSY